jgi:hypothetical protein
VETDDGGDAGESSGSEGQEEGHFFFSRPLDGAEAFEGESEDPEVGDNVEAGGRWQGQFLLVPSNVGLLQ